MDQTLQQQNGSSYTDNPQQSSAGSLQTSTGNGLQQTSGADNMNQLDSGSAAIPLSATSPSTTAPTQPQPSHSKTLYYSGGVLLVLVVVGYMIYSLFRRA